MNRKIWLRSGLATAAAASALVAAGLVAQAGQPGDRPGHMAEDPDHIMLNPEELQWKKGPASLPEGAEYAVLEGDPSSSGPFTMRVKLPADFEIAAHTHPAIEHVTVLSGSFHMGKGKELDTSKGKKLKRGGFAVMAIGTEHYAWTDEEAVIQLHGIGPWEIHYLDPSNDPRNNR